MKRIWKDSKNTWSNVMNKYLKKKKRSRYMTGEDIDMFREREQENKNKRKENICDTHIDGA